MFFRRGIARKKLSLVVVVTLAIEPPVLGAFQLISSQTELGTCGSAGGVGVKCCPSHIGFKATSRKHRAMNYL
jgi:hypothetical protein